MESALRFVIQEAGECINILFTQCVDFTFSMPGFAMGYQLLFDAVLNLFRYQVVEQWIFHFLTSVNSGSFRSSG